MINNHTRKTHFPHKRQINPFLVRSWLIFPAIKERFLQKILTLKGVNKPDVVIFDLEDSIANTQDAKTKARNQLINSLITNKSYRKAIDTNFLTAIRVNHHTSDYCKEDIHAITKIHPHFVIVPKVETEEEVIFYQRQFKDIQLRFVIETIKGYENRNEILRSLRPTDILGIGYEDLCADLGIERPHDLIQPNPLVHIVNCCLISAKQYNISFVEGPSRKYGSRKNLGDCRKECLLSLNMGFNSKLAIHPSQIRIINTIYSKKRLKERARKVLQKFQDLDDGTFVIGDKGKNMMDTPSVSLYSKTLHLLSE